MQPSDLKISDFRAYPPEAETFAGRNLHLLRKMPLALAALVLRELIGYDWKFPAERREFDAQFEYLTALPEAQFETLVKPFAGLTLTPALANVDWVNQPSQFSEQLSAHLWATGQIEQFRTVSTEYVEQVNRQQPLRTSRLPRLVVVVMGSGATGNTYPLFRKLRPHGTYFQNVIGSKGRESVQDILRARSNRYPEAYGHWIVDGASVPSDLDGVTALDYTSLQKSRDLLIARMRQVMAPGGAGPEALRTMMAQMSPSDLHMPGSGPEGLLNRFRISILTEGSGTQLFSTTFVQWSAREILRRAQPTTLLLQYAPRQREQSMQEMLAGEAHQVELDPHGSLIDADMGAYYTWLNAQRLAGSERASFIAWYEGGKEAVAVGPAFSKARVETGSVTVQDLITRANT